MRAVFIGGCGRSGTTLLGDLLGAHPDHICPPETSYKVHVVRQAGWTGPSPDLAKGLAIVGAHPKFRDLGIAVPELDTPSLPALMTRIVSAYAATVGKPDAKVWIDHTPSNVAIGKNLLREFPDAKLIHLVRDGRAVAASMLPLDWGHSVVSAARAWMRTVAIGLALEVTHPGRVLRVSYEELVNQPAEVLQRICGFAGLAYRDEMVSGGGLRVPHRTAKQHALVGKPPDPSRANAWRKTLAPRDIELFEAEVRALLPVLGYEQVFGETAQAMRPLGSLVYQARHLARDLTKTRFRRQQRKSR